MRKSGSGRSINVLMRDGSGRRVPVEQADEMIRTGAAKRFISNTVYKALSVGIEVKDLSTLDKGGALKKQVRERLDRRHKKTAEPAAVSETPES